MNLNLFIFSCSTFTLVVVEARSLDGCFEARPLDGCCERDGQICEAVAEKQF